MFEDFIKAARYDGVQRKYVDVSLSGNPAELKKRGHVPFTLSKMQCCGLREVYSTPWITNFSKDSFMRWLEYNFVGEGDKDWVSWNTPRGGLLIACLKKHELEKLEWCEAVGFKRIQDFVNHVHNSSLVLLTFEIPKDLEKYRFVEEKKEEELKKEKA